MKIIRASEIGTYFYCQRAWWYRRQGYESANTAELASGVDLHESHGRAVMTSGCIQLLAYVFLLLAFVLLAVYAVGNVL